MKEIKAYIDASNLKCGIEQSGWKLNYKSFHAWLRDKFKCTKVTLFMGLIPGNFELYNKLQSYGYDIQFRPTLTSKDGKTKGNVDGELILAIARDYYEETLLKTILVSGDGDYHCIIEFLKEKTCPYRLLPLTDYFYLFSLKRLEFQLLN